jgi:hypothetical protein
MREVQEDRAPSTRFRLIYSDRIERKAILKMAFFVVLKGFSLLILLQTHRGQSDHNFFPGQ